VTSRKSRNRGNIVAFLILLDDHVKIALQATLPFDSKLLCTLSRHRWGAHPEREMARSPLQEGGEGFEVQSLSLTP
jgi:hypothetical protein